MLIAIAIAAPAACSGACGGSQPSGTDAGGTGVGGSCAAPLLTISPTDAHPGDTVEASGEWFAADCYDTGQSGSPPPLTGLRMQVTQGGHTWAVASGIDASGEHYAFHVSVHIPDALAAGDAQVSVVGYGAPVTLHVVDG
jgi:hypothetical protein